MRTPDAFLTPRQKEILEFVTEFIRARGFAPTLREICEEYGYSSYGTAQKHVRLLQEKGYLTRTWNQKRGLTLTDQAAPGSPGLEVEIPLLGLIAAGRPIEAVPDAEPLTVPRELLSGNPEQCFVLRVSGSSMVDEGIQDGDLVVVRRQEEAGTGDMVVALVENEVTLKRIYPQGEKVRLQPSNQAMEPILVPADTVQVQGIVIGLLRKY